MDWKTDDDYSQAWREFRFWQRLGIGMWLGFIPFGGLVVACLNAVGKAQVAKAPFIVIPYMIAWVVVMNKAFLFRCPRCQKRFFSRELGIPFMRYHNGFARRCLNCGLPKYALRDPGEEQGTALLSRASFVLALFKRLYVPLLIIDSMVCAAAFGLAISNAPLSDARHLAAASAALGATSAASLLISLFALTQLRHPNPHELVKKALPQRLRIFAGLYLLTTIYFIPFALLTRHARMPLGEAELAHVFVSPLYVLLAYIAQALTLYCTHRIIETAEQAGDA